MVHLKNVHLESLEEDKFHHLGFSTATIDLKKEFNDVKFVCMSGSVSRVEKFSKLVNKELKYCKDEELKNLCCTDRYVMFKVGPVLIANHGMGIPSTSIILHEIFKLLHYAGAKEVTFFRIGTCGGLGVNAGTVILTRKAVNGLLKPKHTQMILGELREYDTMFGHGLSDEILQLVHDVRVDFPFDIQIGDTLCCDDFYEAQARLDGALCSYTKSEKDEFLKKAYDSGVRNIEMESLVFASMCNRANIPACIVCVVLVNRLEDIDQVKITHEQYKAMEERPGLIVLEYIKRNL